MVQKWKEGRRRKRRVKLRREGKEKGQKEGNFYCALASCYKSGFWKSSE
jgi:hypothetical protein